MDINETVTALSALAQRTRLLVFRLLIERGPEGMPATEIAETIGVRQNLMSTHLSILANAGLTNARREGRKVIHSVNFENARTLVAGLVEDCCRHGADPQSCGLPVEWVKPANREEELAALLVESRPTA